MANEILVLGVDTNTDQRSQVRALFLFPVSPRIATFGGVTIVPTPTASLPIDVTTLALLSEPELAALDSGNAAFELVSLYLTPAQRANLGQAIARITAAYAQSTFVTELRARFEFTGRRVNA